MIYTNEYTHVQAILQSIKDIQAREDKRHMMDAHLTPGMYDLLTEVQAMLEHELNLDDDEPDLSEPPLTLSEMHEAARQQKKEAWAN